MRAPDTGAPPLSRDELIAMSLAYALIGALAWLLLTSNPLPLLLVAPCVAGYLLRDWLLSRATGSTP